MQSGIDSSRLRIAMEDAVTRVDIYRGQKPASASESSGFFGKDGPSFRDALDAINPLNHLPVISDIMKAQTGHEVSAASRLVGGALLGGPIGFLASIAGMVFEEATGKSPGEAVYAALTGDAAAPETQVASSDTAVEDVEVADAASVDAAAPTSGPKDNANLVLSSLEPETQAALAAATRPAPRTTSDAAVLDLYGNSSSAHSSYKKAQMLPYLRDVTTSHVL